MDTSASNGLTALGATASTIRYRAAQIGGPLLDGMQKPAGQQTPSQHEPEQHWLFFLHAFPSALQSRPPSAEAEAGMAAPTTTPSAPTTNFRRAWRLDS